MGILISKVRIENYRSIEQLEVVLDEVNVIIGANNSGKSNFLRAINTSLGQNKIVSSDDIHISNGETLSSEKTAIIDLMIRPCDNNSKISETFSNFWVSVFTESWITTGETDGDYVGIRTIIQYDSLKNDYVILHKQISDWGSSISDATVSVKKAFTADMNTYIWASYMDAQRDIVEDIRNKKSYFGRATSDVKLPDDKAAEIEAQLNDINNQILDNIPTLKRTANTISSIASTVGSTDGIVEIEPLARKLSDLHKGMDIFYSDGDAARLSVSQHGMGTRSWVSFLTLGAYIDWEKNNLLEDDPDAETFVILTMEEPEANLHPQAQQKLYSQMIGFSGQKIISTHSPSVVSQANVTNLIYFEKSHGKTSVHRIDRSKYTDDDINRIKREVINSHGELLFSRAIVLCEGVTEEQALPVFFEKYFGKNPTYFGINIIGIGGQHYRAFLQLIRDFNIDWFIFSDGEKNTIKTVENAVNDVFSTTINDCDNVIILDNEENYEKHLINSGYENEILNAISEYDNNPDGFVKFYNKTNHSQIDHLEDSGIKCPNCNSPIKTPILKDYDGPEGHKKAVYDYCTKGKAKYATIVAEKIVGLTDSDRIYPPKIKELFTAIENLLKDSEGNNKDDTI